MKLQQQFRDQSQRCLWFDLFNNVSSYIFLRIQFNMLWFLIITLLVAVKFLIYVDYMTDHTLHKPVNAKPPFDRKIVSLPKWTYSTGTSYKKKANANLHNSPFRGHQFSYMASVASGGNSGKTILSWDTLCGVSNSERFLNVCNRNIHFPMLNS